MKTSCIIVFLLMCCTACKHKPADTPPDKDEVYDFLLKQVKQEAMASGYKHYKLVINRFDQDKPGHCSVPDDGSVPCFSVHVDRTEYYDYYKGTYVNTYVNDVYQFYRDERGNLTIAGHQPGQVSNDIKPIDWEGHKEIGL